jgi:RNA polymerase sigma-70 factor (ECF subfamily)
MDEHERLVERFEATRPHLRSVAYRMLGTRSEAEDAVQEAWLRLSRSDSQGVENLGGWLTTVVARVCLDMLRARRSRREEPPGARVPEPAAGGDDPSGPEHDALLADSVGVALLVVLDSLAPAERLAFVLHDMFDLPFDEIAPIVGCSPAAARQLASRARRRVQGTTVDPDADLTRHREVVEAFLTASRGGDLSALLAVLDPNVVLRADPVAVSEAVARQGEGAPPLAPEVRGAAAVAAAFSGRARAAQPALVNESLAVVWAPGGQPRAVIGLTIVRGKIAALDVIADPDRLRELDVALLEGPP